MKSALLVPFLLLLGGCVSSHPRTYVAGQVSSPPLIDGRLDDEAWAQAPWTEEFIDIELPEEVGVLGVRADTWHQDLRLRAQCSGAPCS